MVSDKVKYTSYEEDPKRILNKVKKFSEAKKETIISIDPNDFHLPYDSDYKIRKNEDEFESIAPPLRDELRMASEKKQQILDRALDRIIKSAEGKEVKIGGLPMSMLFALAPTQFDPEAAAVIVSLTIGNSVLSAFCTQMGQAMWGGAVSAVHNQRDPFERCEKIIKKRVSLPPGTPWILDAAIFKDNQGSKLHIERGAPQSSYQSLLNMHFNGLRPPFEIHWLTLADVWLAVTYNRQGNNIKKAFIWQAQLWQEVLSA